MEVKKFFFDSKEAFDRTIEFYEGAPKSKYTFDEDGLLPVDSLKQTSHHIVIDPNDPNPTFSVINTTK